MTKPMLCKTYKEFPGACFMQPKLDGIRCIAKLIGTSVFLWSRNEKPLHLPHLSNSLLALFSRLNNTEFFDGELYVHGKSFQDIASLVKRANHPLQETVSYHIYDRQLKAPWKDQKFDTRFYGNDWPKWQHIVKVKTLYTPTKEMADKHHATFVAEGYEGSIYRVGLCRYEEDARSKHLLKRKDWLEDDFLVVDIKEGKGKNENTAILVCTTSDDKEDKDKQFDVTAPGTYINKARIFDKAAKYIGKKLSIKYQNLTDDGIPRFPIALGFKDDR